MRIQVLSRSRLNYSNRRFRQEAKGLRIDLSVTDPTECEMMVSPGLPTLMMDGRDMFKPDVVLPRIGASINNYALGVVTQYEMMDIPVINGSISLYNSKNKLRSIQLMSKTDIDVPRTLFVRRPSQLSEAVKQVGGFPVVLKLLSGTQGIGVMIARDETAIDLSDDYKALALKAASTIGLEIAGVDMLESDQGPKVIEVNSSPGFEGLEMASGLNVARDILQYCKENYGQ